MLSLEGQLMMGKSMVFHFAGGGQRLLTFFFADDCLLFCRATLTECEKIKNIFNIYEAASDQMVNKDKTTLFFSRNTNEATQEAIKVPLVFQLSNIMISI